MYVNIGLIFFCISFSFIFLVDSVSVSTPSFPESVKDGTIRFLKKPGDQVSADETIAEIETDKTNLSVNSPQSGVIEALLVADGDNVTSGAVVAKVDTNAAPGSAPKPQSANKVQQAEAKKAADSSSGPAPSQTPSVPSTPKSPQRETPTSQISVTPAKPSSAPQTSTASGADPNKIAGTRSETRVKMSRMRLKIAERLKDAQNTCAMLTTFNEIDMR